MSTAAVQLHPVQIARKFALLATIGLLIAAFALTRATLLGSLGHDLVLQVGRFLIVLCILGRAWCSLYIGGRKITELVRTGPYSLCRNPLYTLSILGAAGAGAQGGSLVVAVIAGIMTWLVFRLVVAREEATLFDVHGEDYATYVRTTPRFLPNPARWCDSEILEVRPGRVVTTFLDGLLFLAFIPIAGILAKMSEAGLLPVLLYLP